MTDSVAGLVLAAGAGTRMAPLTRLRPKPLLPFGRGTLVDHAIARLHRCAGPIVVNVHHGREQMEAHLDGRVRLSVEAVSGLGTAGGLAHARPLLDGADVVVVNGDTWCPGDLTEVVADWDHERVRVVVAGPGRLTPTSRIVASMYPSDLVAGLPVGPGGLYELVWRPKAEAGVLDVVGWDGQVIDCATPRDYLAANLMAEGRSVIGDGAVVDGTVTRCVVWPGARVWPHEVLVDAVRTDGPVTVMVR